MCVRRSAPTSGCSGGAGAARHREAASGRSYGVVAQGLSTQGIADQVHLSINTVKTHLRTAYRKLGVHSRDEAIRLLDMEHRDRRTASPPIG